MDTIKKIVGGLFLFLLGSGLALATAILVKALLK